jgi:hypothetical protein
LKNIPKWERLHITAPLPNAGKIKAFAKRTHVVEYSVSLDSIEIWNAYS